jgi:hypothetical protein
VKKRGSINWQQLAKAVGSPGIDPRTWVSHATVCHITKDGQPDYTSQDAILIAPDGVWVDVLLVPSDMPATARVQLGVGGKKAQINCPIEPGDQVLVLIPEGILSNPLTVIAILNNQSAKLGLDADKKPQFKNDRLSIFANGIPIEVMTKDGAILRLEADGEASFTVPGGKRLQMGTNDLDPTDGVVTGKAIDSFTGSTQFVLGNASGTVFAKK